MCASPQGMTVRGLTFKRLSRCREYLPGKHAPNYLDRVHFRPRLFLVVAAGALVVSACGDTAKRVVSGPSSNPAALSTSSATDFTTTTSLTTSTTQRSATTTSTIAATTTTTPTTTAPTTTLQVPAIATTLTATGVGSARFGEVSYDDFMEHMKPKLGGVSGAVMNSYVSDGDSYTRREAPPSRFDYPSSRTVCFENSLCIYFGGPSDQDLKFVGFRQYDPGAFGTESGAQVGLLLSNFPDVVQLGEGACAAINGTVDGVKFEANAQPNESSADLDGLIVVLRAGSVPVGEDGCSPS